MDPGRNNVGAHLAAHFATHSLQEARSNRYANEKDGTFILSANAVDNEGKKRRALAEIDGVFAGLTFLETSEDLQAAHDARLAPQPTFDNGPQQQNGTNLGSRDGGPLSRQYGSFPDSDASDIDMSSASGHETRAPSNMRQPESTNEIELAWYSLRAVRRGMKEQHQRLINIASGTSYDNIRKLSKICFSADRMVEMGILTYRDVLYSTVPDTLAEVVAFFSLSKVILDLLAQRARVVKTNILPSLKRWRGCIANADDQEAFAWLASVMWPLESLSTLEEPGNTDTQDGGRSLQRSKSEHPASQPRDPVQPQNAQCEQQDLGEPSSSRDIRGKYFSTSQRREYFQELQPTDEQNTFQPGGWGSGDMGGAVSIHHFEEPMTIRNTRSPTGGPSGPQFHDWSRFRGVSPNYLEWSPHRSLSEYVSPQTFLPLADRSISNPSPPPEECALGHVNKPGMIYFKCTNVDGENNIFNLRDTPVFLSMLAFTHDIADFFYRLSGSGKTVQCTKRGSAYASERSKAERILREELFHPLQRSSPYSMPFLALLSVAERFVVLGSLGTLEEVQDYLVAISREITEPGRDYERAVRWIYSIPSRVPLPGSSLAISHPEDDQKALLAETLYGTSNKLNNGSLHKSNNGSPHK
ncbi:hypothetical protein CSPX01_09764 [Colletotrichum filicis]|nr:hypothetical protein CSPX01_09764 [Colletotrichum filicis]